MKQLEVQIMQQSYLLGCPEGREARLLEAVERVDTAMLRIRDAGKVRARERIAVLAALNLAYQLDEVLGNDGRLIRARALPALRLQCNGLRCCRALYFLEPMLIEPGLGTLPGERDHLASDEPNAWLPSPT